MRKTILAVLALLFWVSSRSLAADPIHITNLPASPLIEKDAFAQYLNFDFVLKNDSRHTLDLREIQLSLIDDRGRLVSRKMINSNGGAPGINIIGNTQVKSGESFNIFNPFDRFDADLVFSKMEYTFSFVYADTKEQVAANKARLPIDVDLSVHKTVTVRPYAPRTRFHLPLQGRILIWDGHDFTSHHRRFLTGVRKNGDQVIEANTNRYAYDMVSIDPNGEMYKDNPFKKENWFVFGKDVFAPAGGRVIELTNDIPDNAFENKSIVGPALARGQDPYGMGNHVIIDHHNGEYSILLHMEAGSIPVKLGDGVQQGQLIGKVGFSGDAIFPHVHYAIANGPREFVSEGLPSCFYDYHLLRGSKDIYVKKGRIDSGDILETAK
ncbi:MAG: M23 family metallopeptidase [Flavisolibacter sp.]